ncbi:N-acetyltransferase [Aerococcaceae bacterium DSM 111020]|nr:N-acetyltransferase [Aerococcaceae bacterium DSM 111020]
MEDLKFKPVKNEIILVDASEEQLGEITYRPNADGSVWEVTHTGVSPKLRGQGVAGKLLDELVKKAENENVKLKAVCPYVVKKFKEEPAKYNSINAEVN